MCIYDEHKQGHERCGKTITRGILSQVIVFDITQYEWLLIKWYLVHSWRWCEQFLSYRRIKTRLLHIIINLEQKLQTGKRKEGLLAANHQQPIWGCWLGMMIWHLWLNGLHSINYTLFHIFDLKEKYNCTFKIRNLCIILRARKKWSFSYILTSLYQLSISMVKISGSCVSVVLLLQA